MGSSGGGGFTFSSNIFVQRVESFSFRAVEVEPPIADEIFLVEDGSVGAKEGVFGKASKTISGTHVECLAVGFGVGIVSSFYLTVASERCFWGFSKDWVISSWLSWDRLQKPIKSLVIISSWSSSGL